MIDLQEPYISPKKPTEDIRLKQLSIKIWILACKNSCAEQNGPNCNMDAVNTIKRD